MSSAAGVVRVAASAFVLFVASASAAVAAEVPRTILALYEGDAFDDPTFTPIHRLAEMPLNHLGLVLRYHDVRRPLPAPESLGDVRGVLTWFQTDRPFEDPRVYVRWVSRVVERGLRVAVLGTPGVDRDRHGRLASADLPRRFFATLGIAFDGHWTANTYDVAPVSMDRRLVGFERPLPSVLPAFARVRAMKGRATAHLTLRQRGDPSTDSDLVVTSSTGAYVAPGFTHYASQAGGRERRQWYLDPFAFLRAAFATDDLPKPDVTTESGRRIFYSHIDGDGWLNRTEVDPYRKQRALSARVVLAEIIDKFVDLPVTVGPVVADLDPAWRGTDESMAVAREIFARPNVEVSSHTYSHPLDWYFFRRYDRVRESAYGRSGRVLRTTSDTATAHAQGYSLPRSYVDHPFVLEQEILGAVDFVRRLTPPGKEVKLVQWSGDTLPFPEAVSALRRAGLRGINGGDTRFDSEYPSYAWVAPIGRSLGIDWQIYSSNSNENTYTNLWTQRFFGFTFLVRTLRNTDSPLRVKPFNVYYHMYSGEKLAALNAVRRVLEYARTEELAPMTTGHYTAIAEGFFSTRIDRLGPRHWRVRDRGALQTIRFDRATHVGVDLARSRGVVGARHRNGSLYVALDEAVAAPEIVVRDLAPDEDLPRAASSYLVSARWQVSHLRHVAGGFRFRARGFGRGDTTWRVPVRGRFRIAVEGSTLRPIEATATGDGLLHFTIDADAIAPITISVDPVGGGP